jgi:4-amino-4-deoxy-L-arabinose transferase-like glycosyltransferase
MPELVEKPTSAQPKPSHIFDSDFGACIILLLAFLLRLWTAYGTFLNPDEALHYRVANKASLWIAYQFSLTTAHPPLLILFLYFWRKIGVSELALRFPSIIAGTAFCWILYKWLSTRFDRNTGWIGLIFASFLPPLVALSAELRQYAFLLLFIVAATYLLDLAFDRDSATSMLLCQICIYLAMLTHYSALLFTAALGIYALLRILKHRPKTNVVFPWLIGQLAAVALFVFLYSTHISQLKANGAANSTIEGWMRNSFYHRGQDNVLLFIVARTFGVFQFVFGQLAVGDVALLLFAAGVVLLIRKKPSNSALATLLVLPFVLACGASISGLYPYGGTRHSAFLALFAITGVSFLLAKIRWRAITGRTLALVIVLLSTAFGSPHRPYMRREDQNRANMNAAINAFHQQAPPNSVIFVDPQTSLQLGHYLCEQKLTPRDTSTAGFESYYCGGYHVITPASNDMIFDSIMFLRKWDQMVRAFQLKEGEAVYVAQAGWDVHLAQDLPKLGGFQDLKTQSFGRNISLFKLIVGSYEK